MTSVSTYLHDLCWSSVSTYLHDLCWRKKCNFSSKKIWIVRYRLKNSNPFAGNFLLPGMWLRQHKNTLMCTSLALQHEQRCFAGITLDLNTDWFEKRLSGSLPLITFTIMNFWLPKVVQWSCCRRAKKRPDHLSRSFLFCFMRFERFGEKNPTAIRQYQPVLCQFLAPAFVNKAGSCAFSLGFLGRRLWSLSKTFSFRYRPARTRLIKQDGLPPLRQTLLVG